MIDSELDRLRNDILSTLVMLRDQMGRSIWLDKRVLANKISHSGPVSDVMEAVGSLAHLEYVEIDWDLGAVDVIENFSRIRLSDAGQAFYDHGNRFVESPAIAPVSTAPSNAVLTESGDFLVTEDGDYIVTEADGNGEPLGFDSQLWTGRVGRVLAETAKRNELILLLENAENDLTSVGASNSERAQARAYIIAARTLAEAPEPPENLIWELIARANALAGVASLFVAIIALFASVGK